MNLIRYRWVYDSNKLKTFPEINDECELKLHLFM